MHQSSNSLAAADQAACCPVCGGHDFHPFRAVFDDRYGHPGTFHLAHCTSCSHLMTVPMLREEDLAHLYGTYYPRKKLSAEAVARQALGTALPHAKVRRWWMGVDNQGQYSVRPGEKMLDVGCGSGMSLLEARQLGAEAWGIEADPNVARIAQALDLRIHIGSLHDQPFAEVKFDLVVLNQVIEHIPEPDKALATICSRLSPQGRVILVFPNTESFWCRLSGARWINWHIPYHLHHFNLKTFTQMADRCGLRVVRSRTITPNVWTLLQLRASRHAAIRGQASAVWSVPDEAAAHAQPEDDPKPFALRRLLAWPVLAVFAVINRSLDLIGQGDSLIVELQPAKLR